jgi:RNA polymerase sigma-70 factor (ECF subfamily)
LQLSIHHGKPHAAIARVLQMPLGTVKSYARRGLLQLRECMERPLKAETAS